VHNLLRRQLRRHFGSEEPPAELTDLFAVIDGAYKESDSDREMVERSLELASNELLERNASLKADIEKRRETEQQLTETLSVLASTLDSTADGILVITLGPERRVSSFNRRFLEMWHIPEDLAETRDPQVLMDAVIDQVCDEDGFVKTSLEARLDPNASTFDVVNLKDGRVFERTSLPRRVDGKPAGRVWCFKDVSERAHAELAVKQSEEKFSKAFHSSPLAIAITSSIDESFVEVNDAFTTLSGYSREEAIGRTSIELRLWADPDLRQKMGKALSETGSARDFHTQFRTKSGELRDGLITAEMIELQGRRCVLSLVVDITERVRAEEAMKASEEYFRSLIEKSSDVILVLNSQVEVSYASPSVTRVMGYKPEDIQGLNGLTFVHADDLPETAESFKRSLEGTNEDVPIEFRGRHADGEYRVLEAMSRRIVDATGEPSVVVNFRDISEKKRAEEKIRFMAYHDALTGLPNRDLLQDRMDLAISQARRAEEELAVIYVDLDRFKNVNDAIGHSGGDELLTEIASRLSHCTRDGDTLARIGGDEFVVLVPRIATVQDAAEVARHILEALRRPVILHGEEFRTTASIGLAVFPEDGHDAATLIRNADVAMYRAKEKGRDNMQMYTASMNAAILERLSIERDLLRAIENQEFTLYYQPIVNASSFTIVGAEALIRWRHPQRGLMAPDTFIPVAEDSGLILKIGTWVLETACRQGAGWERAHPGFVVAVNVSARQLREAGFVALIRDSIWATGISPEALELELTETAAMESPERIGRSLAALKDMGVKPVIDDFGTGYSSLSHLKRLPVTKLKIDKSFTQDVTSDPNDAAIASATIAMAHSLGLIVTAEGVETSEQCEFYQKLQCDELQGYLFGKPGTPEEITRMINSHGLQRANLPKPALRMGWRS